jgi:hypothetical protein
MSTACLSWKCFCFHCLYCFSTNYQFGSCTQILLPFQLASCYCYLLLLGFGGENNCWCYSCRLFSCHHQHSTGWWWSSSHQHLHSQSHLLWRHCQLHWKRLSLQFQHSYLRNFYQLSTVVFTFKILQMKSYCYSYLFSFMSKNLFSISNF